MGTSETPRFEALIVPHRSLGPSGFRWLAGSLGVLSAGVATGLWMAGAWPVIGFTGLEALLAIWLIRRNASGPLPSEMLILNDAGLHIVRTDRAGRRWERRLPGYWLRASLEERPGRTPALMLRGHGVRLEIGSELGEAEKRDLADALRAALDRQRSPVFDNPQLR